MANTYSTGTVAVTNGSTTVTLTGGLSISFNMKPGDDIGIVGGYRNAIETLTDSTHFELARAWEGETGSGLPYIVQHMPMGWGDRSELQEAVVENIRLLADGIPFTAEQLAAANAAAANAEASMVSASQSEAYAEIDANRAEAKANEATAARDLAVPAAASASTDATRAELAAEGALAGGTIYPDIAAGRGASSAISGPDAYFKVLGSGPVSFRLYKRLSSTSEVLVMEQLSASSATDQYEYVGANGVTVVDLLGNVIQKSVNGKIYSALDSSDPFYADIVNVALNNTDLKNMWTYEGPSQVLTTDLAGNILQRYDASEGNVSAGYPRIVRAPLPLKAGDLINTTAAWIGALLAGQSLTVGESANGVISTTQPFANLTFGSGPSSSKAGSVGVTNAPGVSTAIPLVEKLTRAEGGTAGETPCSGLVNYAVERAIVRGQVVQAADYVNFAFTAGHTGYSIAQLTDDAWFQLLRDQVDAFVALATAAGKSRVIPCMFWVQGNADVDLGTTRAAYKTALKAYRLKAQTYIQSVIPGNGTVALIMVQTEYGLSISPDIALAQVDLAKTEPHFYFAGPTFHLPHTGSESHLDRTGYKWLGCYFGRAKQQIEIEQAVPQWLEPLSCIYDGTRARFKWRVPVEPLVLDPSIGGVTSQYGLSLKDSGGLIALSDIRVTAPDEISGVPAAVPLAGATGRIGLDYIGSSISLLTARTCNVRDSATESALVNGVARPLISVSPSYELPVLFLQG